MEKGVLTITEKQVKKNIRVYYLYIVLREPFFWGPVLLKYLEQAAGMPLSQALFMESVCAIYYAIFEVVSGVIADTIGRKKTVVWGVFILFAGTFAFAIAENPWQMWVSNILFFSGFGLSSGADDSLLYDSLKSVKNEKAYEEIIGKAHSFKFLVFAITCFGVGELYKIFLRLPIILSLFFLAINLVVALHFKEASYVRSNNKTFKSYFENTINGFKNAWKSTIVVWVIGFSLLIAVVSKCWFFSYNEYFKAVKLPIEYYGYYFSALNLVACLASLQTKKVTDKYHNITKVCMIIFLLAVPIYVMGRFVFASSVTLILIQNIVRGYQRPFLSTLINNNISSETRATINSIASSVNGLGMACGLYLCGKSIESSGLAYTLQLMSFFTLGCGVVIVLGYFKLFKENNS